VPAPDDAIFAALGDPTRRALLDRLSRDGPLTATQLALGWPVSRQALVKHLGSLAAAGLVDTARQGREVRYEVVAARLEDAARWLSDVGRRWDRRLDALEAQLREAGPPAL
jgi:DNA-binding transcriptional ArsR family regulator